MIDRMIDSLLDYLRRLAEGQLYILGIAFGGVAFVAALIVIWILEASPLLLGLLLAWMAFR